MDQKCKLCDGKKVIHQDLGFGFVIGPCPQCNENYRKQMGYSK